MAIPKFSDYVEHKPLEGEKVKIEKILGKKIVVTAHKITKSKYKTEHCVTLQFYYADDEAETKYIVFSGSTVIRDQVEEIAQKLEAEGLPVMFETTVQNIGKFYALT